MAIFTPEQLRTWLRYDEADYFDAETARLAEQVVTGWLLAEIGTMPTPEPVAGHPLFGWALELGGIAYENPTAMQDDQAGETRSVWSDRRAQILASARRWAETTGSASGSPKPRGRFPKARPWPDGWPA